MLNRERFQTYNNRAIFSSKSIWFFRFDEICVWGYFAFNVVLTLCKCALQRVEFLQRRVVFGAHYCALEPNNHRSLVLFLFGSTSSNMLFKWFISSYIPQIVPWGFSSLFTITGFGLCLTSSLVRSLTLPALSGGDGSGYLQVGQR